MSCSCGKNKKPTGFGKTPAEAKREQKNRNTAKKNANSKDSFVLQKNGKTQRFSSRLEADAARARAGFGTVHRI